MITEVIKINADTSDANQNVNELSKNINNVGNSADQVGSKSSGAFNKIGSSVKGLFPALEGTISGMKGVLVQMWAIVANPLGAILAAIVLVMTSLFMVFKNFQPLVDKVEQGMAALGAVFNIVSNAVTSLFTGTKSLSDAFGSLGSDMNKAAIEAANLAKAQQDLEDVLASQEVQTARNRAEINKLNVQAKNRTLSEQERLKLLERAAKLEDADYQQRLKNSNQEVINARRAIEIKAGFSEKEKKFLKEQGQAAKELAESKGGNYDEEFKKLSEVQRARISLEDEATSNLEKNQNKRDKLEDDAKEKREKAISDAQAMQTKLREQEAATQKILDEKIKEREAFQKDVNAGLAKLTIDSINNKVNEALFEEENQRKRLESISNEVNAIEEANAKKIELDKKTEEERKTLAQKTEDFKIGLAVQTLDLLGSFAKRGSALAKGVAVAQAVISTYQGVNKALAETTDFTPTQTLRFINAGLVGAAGFANVAKILSTKEMGGGGNQRASFAGGGGSAPSAPSFNLVQGTGANQIASSIAGQNRPIEAYVVSSNVTTAQGLDRNIIENSKI